MQEILSNTFTPAYPLKTAVLFLIFNRPDTTKQVFDAIRKAKPPRLYVAADGLRAEKPGEVEKVEQVRRIATQLDWECEVKTLFRDKNLGCKIAVSSAIDWFFENEEEGIILEDDCLPSQSFFWFCEELLERYRDDERIMMISGDNFQFGKRRTHDSYYFSQYTHIWGWASWRRAWINYDVQIKLWPEIKGGRWLFDISGNKKSAQYWTHIFDNIYNGKIDTWDYQMNFTCWSQNMLVILPNINLISNIGFDGDATHTTNRDNTYSEMPVYNLLFPLKHPNWMIRDDKADNYTQKTIFNQPNIFHRVIRRLYRLVT